MLFSAAGAASWVCRNEATQARRRKAKAWHRWGRYTTRQRHQLHLNKATRTRLQALGPHPQLYCELRKK